MIYMTLIATLCTAAYKQIDCHKKWLSCVSYHQTDAMNNKLPIPNIKEAIGDCMVGLGMDEEKTK